VAGFAGTAVRPGNKLAAMGILMAIHAMLEPRKTHGRLRTRNNRFGPDVASGTGEISMLAAQWKVRGAVVKCSHRAVLPAGFFVTGFALASILTPGKTSVVGIGVTVSAP